MSHKLSSSRVLKYVTGFENYLRSEALPNALPLYQNSPQKNMYNLFSEILSGTAFTAPRHMNRSTLMYRIYPTVIHTFRDFERVPTIDKDFHLPTKSSNNSENELTEYYSSIFHNALFEKENKNFLPDFNTSKNQKISLWTSPPFETHSHFPPIQMRWFPLDMLNTSKNSIESQVPFLDFTESLLTIGGQGSPLLNNGGTLLLYNCNKSMHNKFIANHDAEMLIIPYNGPLLIRTEMGEMTVEPWEIACIPRSLKFQVNLISHSMSTLSPEAKTSIYDGQGIQEQLISANSKNEENYQNTFHSGYVCENYGSPFKLPELGPIGINSGLAHPRHFLIPVASFDSNLINKTNNNLINKANKNLINKENEDILNKANKDNIYELFVKYRGSNWIGTLPNSPFDVIAWHGNNVPYKYDLRLFTSINSVSHDHPDPSIFTVLTSPSSVIGTANMDFVVFPPRWNVAVHTFRPPWFHRNFMSELMGLISGKYDGKEGGFLPGGVSLHNQMVAHGPDYNIWKAATNFDTSKPSRLSGSIAFMLESCISWQPTNLALYAKQINGNEWKQNDYPLCWDNLQKNQFDIQKSYLQKIPFE